MIYVCVIHTNVLYIVLIYNFNNNREKLAVRDIFTISTYQILKITENYLKFLYNMTLNVLIFIYKVILLRFT